MSTVLTDALERARADPHYGFDTLRDELAALPEAALPDLLAAAKDPGNHDVLGQMVAALSDSGWPGALESMVEWVLGEDPWLAVDAGCALAKAGGEGFDFWGEIAPDNQPEPAKIQQVAPELVKWWRDSGHEAAPDLETWRASVGRAPSREERIFALVRSNPYAVLGDGRVVETSLPLPRNLGHHYTGGLVVVDGVGEVAVAFVLDSHAEEPMVAVMAESQQGWIDIRAKGGERRPNHTVGDTPSDAFSTRLEVGPTGSVRERAPGS